MDDDEEKPVETDKKESDEDAAVEEEKDEKKPKTKKVEKTTWDWELINSMKPLWTRKYDSTVFYFLYTPNVS